MARSPQGFPYAATKVDRSTIDETDLRGEKPSSSEQHTHLLDSLPQLQPSTGLFHSRWRQSYSAVDGLGGSPFPADFRTASS